MQSKHPAAPKACRFFMFLNFLPSTRLSSELIINSTDNGGRIALLHDRNLVEFHYEKGERSFRVGDLYIGTVRRVVPGLTAAFVDVGYEKDAFLHYSDLGPNIRSLVKYVNTVRSSSGNGKIRKINGFKLEEPIDKHGKMQDVLKANQQMLVQVVKEPISTKGPRLTCQISLAGRYLVLVPFDNRVMISRKLSNKNERKRLQKLISSIKPPNFGVIVRTMAENADVSELDKDLQELVAKWEEGMTRIPQAKPRDIIIGEVNRAATMLRDMLNESFDSILVDDSKTYQSIKEVIRSIAPEKEKIVKHYNGRAKIFEAYGIEKQLKLLFGKTVSLPNGGYLIIEHTEALHVIDVNSGNKATAESDQETTALNVNLEAASEVARQLRLRDMGGIIVIDFIDMRKADNKRQLFQHMKNELRSDRSKYTVLPLTKFGLMQITRQRVRPELNITTRETCPTCLGTGKVAATIGVAEQIESRLSFLLTQQNEKNIKLVTHPYLQAYFTKGFPSTRLKWLMRFHKWVKVSQDTSLALNEYHFFNRHGEEIEF